MNKSNLFKTAWTIAKEGAVKFGGSSREYFASSLKLAYKLQGGITMTYSHGEKLNGITLLEKNEWKKYGKHRVYFTVQVSYSKDSATTPYLPNVSGYYDVETDKLFLNNEIRFYNVDLDFATKTRKQMISFLFKELKKETVAEVPAKKTVTEIPTKKATRLSFEEEIQAIEDLYDVDYYTAKQMLIDGEC